MIANPTLMIERERRRPIPSKQATLDLFQTLAGELPPLQHDLLERQSFSLANAKNVTPFVYHARDTQLQVYAVPEDGMATIGASDVLIWTAGHTLAAQDYRPSTTRSFGFTPYELPVAICRATSDHEYQVLKGALTRLRSTLIRMEELSTRSGRCQSIEFVVPASSYQGVLDPLLVPRSRGENRRSGTAHRQGASHDRRAPQPTARGRQDDAGAAPRRPLVLPDSARHRNRCGPSRPHA
jgi:plasmid replication initiation protein